MPPVSDGYGFRVRLAVIIPAAGASTRYSNPDAALGVRRHKLDEDIGGRSVLQRSVELFTSLGSLLAGEAEVGPIIVAGPHDESAMAEFQLRHGDKLALLGATLVRGGAVHRYESVAAALEHVPEDATHIAVHDAARPVIEPALIDRVVRAAQAHGAAVPGVPVADTLKRVGDPVESATDDPLDAILAGSGGGSRAEARAVESTIDRTGLYQIQTPQVFEADLFRRAYAQDDLSSTDDAGLVERLGERVVVVEGDPLNIKITRPRDLEVARAAGGFRAPEGRPSHKRF